MVRPKALAILRLTRSVVPPESHASVWSVQIREIVRAA